MRKGRLLKLARLLEADAKMKCGIKFDLGVVAQTIGKPQRPPKWSCGTVACAIGLWGISQQFPGVSLVPAHNGFWPKYRGSTGRDAAQVYFEISERESAWLFLGWYYQGQTTGAKGELMVAARIRDFVAGREKPYRKAA